MQKRYLFFLLLSICLGSKAQITPVHTVSGQALYPAQLTIIHLSQHGDKYVEVHGTYTTTFSGTLHPYPDTIFIYNPDFTSFKKIVLPDSSSRYLTLESPYFVADLQGGPGISSVTDNLFNNDSLIEYAVTSVINPAKWSILNELGNVIFTASQHNGGPTLLKMNSNYYIYSDTTIYSLPGTLPCSQCNSFPAGIIEPQNSNGTAGLNAYPNPFNNMLTLEYYLSGNPDNARITITDILGREIQSMKLTSQSDKIVMMTTNLPKGTLIVSLFNNTADPISRKVIKID
jgi:hypothetical protein